MKFKRILTFLMILFVSLSLFVPNIKAANKEMGNLIFIVKFKDDTKETYNEDYTYNAKYSKFTYFENQVNDNSDSYIPNSFEKYINILSNGQLNVRSYFPQKNEDNRTIKYITLDKNKSDYNSSQSLLNDCLSKMGEFENNINASEVDKNNDGYIDNLTIMVQIDKVDAPKDNSDVIWPHKADNNNYNFTIAGKSILNYNVLNTQASNLIPTMVHEFLHSLGVLDLYSKDSTKTPVGPYDVMSKVGSAPSYPLAQTRKMLGFDTIKDISGSGTKSVTLYAPYSNKGDNAVMVKTPLKDNEYFVFEYRKKTNLNDSNNVDSQIPYSGLVCYRVNDALSDSDKSNFNNKNYIYVFRPNDTGINDFAGDINNAVLSLSDGKRSEIGSSDENATIKDNALVYTNDVNSRIQLKVTSQGDDYIIFDITIPDYSSENVWSDLTDTSLNTNYFADSDNAKSIGQIGNTLYFLNKNKVYQYKDGVYSSLGIVDSNVNNGNLVILNNEVYVFYADYSSKKESVVLKKYENGNWIEKSRISTNGSYANVPYAINLNGELYCLYDLDNTNVTIMKWNGSEFLTVGKITDCKYLMAPSMAVYKNELYVMLSDFQNKNEGGIIYKQTNNGFKKVYNVNSSANHFQKFVVSEDNIYAFTYNTSSNKTNIAVSADGKSWSTDKVATFEEKVNSISFDIKDGDLYLGVVDSNGVAKMYSYKDSSWNKVGSNIYSNASSMSFILGSDKIYAYLGDSIKYKTLVKYNEYLNKDDNTNTGNGEGGSSEGGNTTVDPPKDDTTVEKPKA